MAGTAAPSTPGEVQTAAHALAGASHAVRGVPGRGWAVALAAAETRLATVWRRRGGAGCQQFLSPDRDDDSLITGKRHPFQHR